jgi:hypothetical protein
MDLLQIKNRLAKHPLVKGIDVVPRGHVRIETALLYPDGGSIDVFIPGDQLLFEEFDVTDFGQTTAWLLD